MMTIFDEDFLCELFMSILNDNLHDNFVFQFFMWFFNDDFLMTINLLYATPGFT